MNINPDYQRDVVWSESRMVHLIDSLFNNYYVPPLIFKVISGVKPGTNERRKWRTCIDGKQRLTTIRRFFDGEIPYLDKQRRKWYYSNPEDLTGPRTVKRKLLSDEEKEFINNVQIVNIEFEYLTEEQEEDMFQRVQLGVPLTVAEKLAALTGEIPSFCNDLRRAYTHVRNLMGTKRSLDFKLVTQLVYLMHCRAEDEDEELRMVHGASLRKFLEQKDYAKILTPAFRAQARRVFGKYNELIAEYGDVFTHTFGKGNTKSRRFSPVEFLGVGIMLDMYIDRPNRVLAEDIKTFREHLRARLQDLRTNTSSWTQVMDFVLRLQDSRGYYPPEPDTQSKKRTVNGIPPVIPRQLGAFNPPTPDQQIHTQNTSVYNERQQKAIEARLAAQQREQKDAFNRIPLGRALNGPTKRTHEGTPVKRERN